MYKNKITQALLLGAGMAVAATSFSSLAADVPAGTKLAKVQELVRGNGAEIESVDPHKVSGVPESHVIRDLFEGLLNQDANGSLVPGVAESWETSDNQHYTFKLRKDAKWSNGDKITAHDFVFSFQRLVDPATASPYATYLGDAGVVNAKEIVEGTVKSHELGVKAIDDFTLKVSLKAPIPYFLKMLGHTSVKPVHKATVEKFGDAWTKPENFVGNGAYVLSQRVINEKTVLTRSETYWDNSKTVVNKVSFMPIESQVAEMNRFLSGELHISDSVPNEQFKRLEKEYPESVLISPLFCTYYYGFNNQQPPFDDKRVRKALSYAIDRDVITKAIWGQGQQPAYAFTPPITADFTQITPEYATWTQKERVEKAKALLAEAGYNKANPLKVNLLYNTNENHKKTAAAVQSMWKKSLGVNISIENQEWKTYVDNSEQHNFEVRRAGWCGDYNEASTFLSTMRSTASYNYQDFQSKEFDKLLDEAFLAVSDEEREAIYHKAEFLLADEMPIAPIFFYTKPRLLNPQVGGFPFENAEEMIYTKDLYLKAK
ncbi:ABC transporter substrate-binding protein [Vibrio penaeicida]|uniref:Peptide ABC transporter substrate-binding protein n=1 Tax=Vibrio penaeicida TaxID=104609 RepID=A0AAV5NRV8_9VIBR|nr:ABC transporter substrate-binding protein [Vibrio penaeicida]RTZ20898.1 oligopeptide ABC transporter substrate-binding protein OppA [Vibrio penaeicida]GLQ72972.1 peptide ABC transporter substrate-binding protein [Vibrio penaeicida]